MVLPKSWSNSSPIVLFLGLHFLPYLWSVHRSNFSWPNPWSWLHLLPHPTPLHTGGSLCPRILLWGWEKAGVLGFEQRLRGKVGPARMWTCITAARGEVAKDDGFGPAKEKWMGESCFFFCDFNHVPVISVWVRLLLSIQGKAKGRSECSQLPLCDPAWTNTPGLPDVIAQSLWEKTHLLWILTSLWRSKIKVLV